MNGALASLIAANIAFVGSHLLLSHPLRAPIVRRLGERGFPAIYVPVALATFAWIVVAFLAVGPGGPLLWNGQSTVVWIVTSLLTIVAMALLLASLRGNPALPRTSSETVAAARPVGVYTVTRHPMMWAFALWAIGHVLVSPSPRTLVTAGSIGFLALVGAHLQDRKKEALLGGPWRAWEERTSYWPHPGRLGAVSPVLWLLGIAIWLGVTYLHVVLAYVPAGVWRWLL